MFPYPQFATDFTPLMPVSSYRRSKHPSISFCPAFARGYCQLGEVCKLNHINVSGIWCRYEKQGRCKFGDCCFFNHKRSSSQAATSDFSPVIQQTVLENYQLEQRLANAELRIAELEREITLLKDHKPHHVPCLNSDEPAVSRKQSSSAKANCPNYSKPAHGQPPVLDRHLNAPKNSPHSTKRPSPVSPPAKPKKKTAKIPWVQTSKHSSSQEMPLKEPPAPVCQEPPKLPISTLQYKERTGVQLNRSKTRPKTLPTCPPTRYPIDPSVNTEEKSTTLLTEEIIREEKIMKLEQLFIESMKELLASFQEFPKMNLPT